MRGLMKGTEEKLIDIIVEAAQDKKASDIKVLKLGNVSRIADFLVICSGDSSVQLRAIVAEVERRLLENNFKGISWEGTPASGWLILDAGNIVVHVMRPEQREYYNLEDLWGNNAVVYHC